MYLLPALERLDSDDREIVQTFLDVDTMTLERAFIRKQLDSETDRNPDGIRKMLLDSLRLERHEKFFASMPKNVKQQYRFFKSIESLRGAKDHSLIPVYEFGRSLQAQQEIFDERAIEIFPCAFVGICEIIRNQLERSGSSVHSVFVNSGNYSKLLKSAFSRDESAYIFFNAIDVHMLQGHHFYNALENTLSWGLKTNLHGTHLYNQLTDILAESINLQGEIGRWRERQTSMLIDDPYLRLLESLDGQNRRNN